MRRSTLNLFIDAVTFAAFMGMVSTGLVVRFVLPPGSRGGQGLSVWSLDRHEWGDIHFWLAVSLIGLLLIHLVMHWTWVCQVTRSVFKSAAPAPTSRATAKRAVIGVVVLAGCAALIAAFVYLASAGISEARGGESGPNELHRGPPVERRIDDGARSRGGEQRRQRRGSKRS